MIDYPQLIAKLTTPEVMGQFSYLYGNREGQMLTQLNRHKAVLIRHEKHFDAQGPVWLISAPGRVEIGGNHTDHNRAVCWRPPPIWISWRRFPRGTTGS